MSGVEASIDVLIPAPAAPAAPPPPPPVPALAARSLSDSSLGEGDIIAGRGGERGREGGRGEEEAADAASSLSPPTLSPPPPTPISSSPPSAVDLLLLLDDDASTVERSGRASSSSVCCLACMCWKWKGKGRGGRNDKRGEGVFFFSGFSLCYAAAAAAEREATGRRKGKKKANAFSPFSAALPPILPLSNRERRKMTHLWRLPWMSRHRAGPVATQRAVPLRCCFDDDEKPLGKTRAATMLDVSLLTAQSFCPFSPRSTWIGGMETVSGSSPAKAGVVISFRGLERSRNARPQ